MLQDSSADIRVSRFSLRSRGPRWACTIPGDVLAGACLGAIVASASFHAFYIFFEPGRHTTREGRLFEVFESLALTDILLNFIDFVLFGEQSFRCLPVHGTIVSYRRLRLFIFRP
jgi:hypothetical protein